MIESIAAAEANRGFSTVLRRVREGHSYVVTAHGRPVARIVPYRASGDVVSSAREALFGRLESRAVTDAGRWTRDELHER